MKYFNTNVLNHPETDDVAAYTEDEDVAMGRTDGPWTATAIDWQDFWIGTADRLRALGIDPVECRVHDATIDGFVPVIRNRVTWSMAIGMLRESVDSDYDSGSITPSEYGAMLAAIELLVDSNFRNQMSADEIVPGQDEYNEDGMSKE